eukprot:CFRG2407T1
MVKETKLYDLLNVAPTADASEIKKGYRRMALKYHPDKNSEPGAEEMFKSVSEAYQVLSDENQRKIYDERGMSGIDVSKQGGSPEVAKEMFRSIFGGDHFVDIFGELEIINSVLDMFGEDLANMTEEEQKAKIKEKEEKANRAAEEKKEHVTLLAVKLISKTDRYLAGDEKGFRDTIMAEANDLAELPGGSGLVELIGHIYVQEAKQHLDRWFGLEKIFSELGEKKNTVGNLFSLASAMAGTQRAAAAMEGNEDNIANQEQLTRQALRVIWGLGKFEICGTLRSVCEKAMGDVSVRKARRDRISLAIEKIGEIYQKVAAQTKRAEAEILAAIANGTIDNLYVSQFRLMAGTRTLREVDMEKPDELLSAFKKLRNVELEIPEGTDVLKWEVGVIAKKDVENVSVNVKVIQVFDSTVLSEGVPRAPADFVARIPKIGMKDERQTISGVIYDRTRLNRTVDVGRRYKLFVTVSVGERQIEKFESKFILKSATSILSSPKEK